MSDTIPNLLRDAARQYGDKPALSCASDGAISFAELDRAADSFAKAMLGDGMQPGERMVIWAPNMWEWVAAVVGAQRVGGVVVPLNTRLKGGEVADIARRARVSRVVSIGDFLGRYYPEMLRDQVLPELRRVVVLRADPAKLGANEESWGDFLKRGDAVEDSLLRERAAAVTPDSISDIMFTSGTTGSPKGAIFDHRRSLGGGHAWNNLSRMNASDRFCCFGPFSHNASYKAGWVAGLLAGCTTYWPETFDAESVLALIARNRITNMPAPPTVWQECLNSPAWADRDLSSLKFLSTGGTVVPIELIRRLARDTTIEHITTGYGMTECAGSATHTKFGDSLDLVAYTVGTAIEGTEIRVADAQGRSLPTGEPGEVLVRDQKLLIEYLDDPVATRAALDQDGWLHTGDVGMLDDNGYLKLTDRLKDMYIVGGFNVYPAEIEKQMGSLPGLDRCAIIGVPDARLGEVGHAFVVRMAGSSLTEAEVIAWSKANLANYKVPRGVTFLDSLPMNSTGKVIKYALRELLTASA